MKAILSIIILSAVVVLAQNVVTQPDGTSVYGSLTASQKARAIAGNASALDEYNRAQAQALSVQAAIARLKKSAATNQDIADILTLLRVINSQFNP